MSKLLGKATMSMSSIETNLLTIMEKTLAAIFSIFLMIGIILFINIIFF